MQNPSAVLPHLLSLENTAKTTYRLGPPHTGDFCDQFELWLCSVAKSKTQTVFKLVYSPLCTVSGYFEPLRSVVEKSLGPILRQLGSWEKGFQRRAEAIQGQAPPVYFGMANILFELKNPNIRQLANSLKGDLNLLE